jgi:hypothetical protein
VRTRLGRFVACALAVRALFRESGWPRREGDRLGEETRWMWVSHLQHDLVGRKAAMGEE